jgi:hypothetical protein
VASPGVAESFLKCSHITRTRHAHQIIACSLYILLRKFYQEYVFDTIEDSPTFEMWCSERKEECPQFLYWFTCLEIELLILTFVRSLHIGDFALYVDALLKLTPWFFSLNHTNYARWMPIHIRDMQSLAVRHPGVAEEL